MCAALQPDELFKAAQARAASMSLPRAQEAQEQLRAQALALFSKIPEPPVYHRVEDPARKAAEEELERRVELEKQLVGIVSQADIVLEGDDKRAEETIERIVGFFRHAAQGLEERKQIVYLLGPVGGGLLAASLGFWSAFLVPGAILLALAVGLVLAYVPRTGKATAAWRALVAGITR